MKIKQSFSMTTLGLIASITLFAAAPLHAQEEDTMVVIDDDTTVDEVANVIELPSEAAAEAVENAARGLDTANAAREGGREFGEAQAENARERGREARDSAGQDARDRARDARDNQGGARDGGDRPGAGDRPNVGGGRP